MEGLNCNFGLGGLKNCFHIIILSFGNCVDRSDLIGDRDYDEATVVSWIGLGDLPRPTLKCQFPYDSGRSQAPRCQQGNALKHPIFGEKFPVRVSCWSCVLVHELVVPSWRRCDVLLGYQFRFRLSVIYDGGVIWMSKLFGRNLSSECEQLCIPPLETACCYVPEMFGLPIFSRYVVDLRIDEFWGK
ncbi:hypothetical protein F511_19088 [Dorcoceras hygrometricum]|uniref:Uncharacterized protein n=1 Tax=Dorcoceras hygrometricum TaxID=472368 RepID=A0A2Z7BYS6_9LAMI|nr:hypothetical protein F511_19088 [Dorcoceras hygrometricum]